VAELAILLEAKRELFRPMPIHFSRWGAKREAAIFRWQLGQTHSAGRLMRAAAAAASTSAAAVAEEGNWYCCWKWSSPPSLLGKGNVRDPLLLVSSAPSKSEGVSPVEYFKKKLDLFLTQWDLELSFAN